MKIPTLTGTLLFLAIVNIVAVDTYLYFTLVRPGEGSDARGEGGDAVVGSVSGAPRGGVSKLNEGQRKDLARIKREFREATAGIYASIRERDDEMYRLLQREPLSEEEIGKNLEAHAALRLELKRIAVRKMIDARSVLTPAQREELFRVIFRLIPRSGISENGADSPAAGQPRRPGGSRP